MAATNSIPTTKICSKCSENKSFEHYHARPAGKYGVHSICKECRKVQGRDWQARNPDRAREIQRESKRRIRQSEEGRKRLSRINGEYVSRNREKVNAYYKGRAESDPLFALKKRYRGILAKAVLRGGYTKRSRSQLILGCTWEEFKAHIERQFVGGMSWERRCEIHIDHIVPLASAKTEEDVIRLNHFTNLRPLWAKDNLEKSDQLTHLI